MNPLLKAAITSWKTALMASLAAAIAILAAIEASIDGDPETVANWNEAVPLLLLAIGLFFGRDADKSSVVSGVK